VQLETIDLIERAENKGMENAMENLNKEM